MMEKWEKTPDSFEEGDDLFTRMKKIFDEKEVEFQNWEKDLSQKQQEWERYSADLQRSKEQFKLNKQNMENKKYELEEREKNLQEKEEQLKVWQQTIEEKLDEKSKMIRENEEKLNYKIAAISKKESELELIKKCEIEDLNNEKLKIKREKKALEAERSKLGLGIYHEEPDLDCYISRDELQEKYLLKAEAEKKISAYQDDLNAIQHSNQILEKHVETLEQEKADLLKKVIGINTFEEPKDLKQNDLKEPISSIPLTQKEEQLQVQEDEGTDEELTADVLSAYLKKNKVFENVEFLHAKDGDQISAKKGLLNYRFVFCDPPYFDVYANKEVDRKIKKVIDALNISHPELKITTESDLIRVTGYFTKDMPVWDLLNNVNRATDCFNQ